MGFIPHYLKPPNNELIDYAQYLFDNASKSRVVKRIEISDARWTPKVRDCHNNAINYCELHPDCKPIHGWIYFDLSPIGYVRFMAHSVVQQPNGQLCDITPAGINNEYPFIESYLEDTSYSNVLEQLNNAHQISYLDHKLVLKKDVID